MMRVITTINTSSSTTMLMAPSTVQPATHSQPTITTTQPTNAQKANR